MARVGGGDSNIDKSFADAYERIAGQGRSSREQIEQIRNSVDNKLVSTQQDQVAEGKRKLSAPENFFAQAGEVGNWLSTAAGDFLLGKDEGHELEDDFGRFALRSIVNMPGGVAGIIPRNASRIGGETILGTDYTYYDPEDATVPEGKLGEHDAAGRLAALGAAGVELLMTGKGAGMAGRLGSAATRGAAGVAAGRLTGTGALRTGANAARSAFKGETGIVNTAERAGIRGAYERLGNKNFATKTAQGALEEGIQEVAEETLEWAARHDEDLSGGTLSQDQYDELGKSALYGFAGGAIGGGFWGGLGGAWNQYQDYRDSKNPTESEALDNNREPSPSTGAVPSSYMIPSNAAIEELTKGAQPDHIKAGQAGTVFVGEGYGVDGIGLGYNTFSAIYRTQQGKEAIDAVVGEENVGWITEAVLNSRDYVSRIDPQRRGPDAALFDLDAFFREANIDSLAFKNPATGKQMLMMIEGIEAGTGLWVNGDTAGIFNGDFDTDKLGLSLLAETMKSINGKDVKLRPSELLLDPAVRGKTTLDPEYVFFQKIDKKMEDQIREVLEEAGIDSKDVSAFLKEYSSEDAETRMMAAVNFISHTGKDLPTKVINLLWRLLRGQRERLTAEEAQRIVDKSRQDITREIRKTKEKVYGWTGTVNEDSTSITAGIAMNSMDFMAEGPAMRRIASMVMETRRTDSFDSEEISYLNETAQSMLVNTELKILTTGQTPISLLLELYHRILGDRILGLINKDGVFKSLDDFRTRFINPLNETRENYEASQYYKVIKQEMPFKGFAGYTENVKEFEGAIIEFRRTFGNIDATTFFDLPPAYSDYSVEQLFTAVAEAPGNQIDAFMNYGEEQGRILSAIANSHLRTAEQIARQGLENVVEVMKTKLDMPNGVVIEEHMGAALSRWGMVSCMLKDSISKLNLSTIQALREVGEDMHQALMGDSPRRLFGLVLSLKFRADTLDLQRAIAQYQSTKSLVDYKRMLWEAALLKDGASPLYKTVADQVTSTELGADTNNSITRILSNLYKEEAPNFNILEEYLGGYYEISDVGTTLGSLAADILGSSDDIVTLSQTKTNFSMAKRFAVEATMSMDAYSRKEWSEANALMDTLGYSEKMKVDLMKRIAFRPTAVSEEVLSEQLRESSKISNPAKEKASDNPYSVLLAESMLLVNMDGRQTADSQMFDVAAGQVDTSHFFASKKQLRDIIWGPADTSITLMDEFGRRSKTYSKVEFFKELADIEWNERNEDQNIMALFAACPKIAKQLGSSRISISITGKPTISEARSIADTAEISRLRDEATQRELDGIEQVKSWMAGEMRIREIILRNMKKRHGESLPWNDSKQFYDIFLPAWNQMAEMIYHNLGLLFTEKLDHNMLATMERRRGFKNYLMDLKEILADRIYDNAINNFSVFNDTAKGGMKLNAIVSMEAEKFFGEKDIVVTSSPSVSSSMGARTILNEEQKQMLSKIDRAIEVLKLSAVIEAEDPSPQAIIDKFAASLPKSNIPEHREAYKALKIQKEKEEQETGNAYSMPQYKKLLVERFAKDFDYQEALKSAGDNALYNAAVDVMSVPSSIEEAVASDTEKRIEASEVQVRTKYGYTSALEIFKDIKKRRLAIIEDLNEDLDAVLSNQTKSLKSLRGQHNIALAAVQEANPVGSEGYYQQVEELEAQYKERLVGMEKELNRAKQARQNRADALMRDLQNEWENLRISILADEISNTMILSSKQGDPLYTGGFTKLEELQSQFLEMLMEYKENIPYGEKFFPLINAPLETRNQFRMPEMDMFDPELEEIAKNAQMSMRGGLTPGGVSFGAEGTGWMGALGEAGGYAKCSDQGHLTTLDEALSHSDLSLIEIVGSDGKQHSYHLSSGVGRAKLNAILDIDPEAEVRAFYWKDCKCRGICMNHTTKPKNNKNTSDNQLSTFYNRLSFFMQEASNMLQKKALDPSDIKLLFTDMVLADPQLQPRYIDVSSISEKERAKSLQDFRVAWRKHIERFIHEQLNGGSDIPQEMLLDLDYAYDVAAFVTRFASLRVIDGNGNTFEEYCHVGDMETRIAEIMEESQGTVKVEFSPVMVSPERSSYAAIRYANRKEDGKTSRSKLLMLGFQNPGHKVSFGEKDGEMFIYLDDSESFDTFAPGTVNIKEGYGRMVPQHPDPTILPPNITDSAYMNYIKRVYGEAGSKARGNKQYAEIKDAVLIKPDSLDILGNAPKVILGNELFSNMILVNKRVSQSRTSSQALRNVPTPAPQTQSDSSKLEFGTNMARMFTYGRQPVMILDDISDFHEYVKWAENRYDEPMLMFVPKGSDLKGYKNWREPDYSKASPGYDAYTIMPRPPVTSPTNGYSVAPQPVQDFYSPVVGGPEGKQANAEIILPNSFIGKRFLFRHKATLPINDFMKGRTGKVTFLGPDEQQNLLSAWNESLRPEAERADYAPIIDWGDRDSDWSFDAKNAAITSWDSAEITNQGTRKDARAQDILCVIKLPKKGKHGVEEYKVIFLEDLPTLGAQTDVVNIETNNVNGSFIFRSSFSTTLTQGIFKKLLGRLSAYKGTATPALDISDTTVMKNGQSAIEMVLADLQKKTEQSRYSIHMKLWVAYQFQMENGAMRNFFGQYDPTTKGFVPKATMSKFLREHPDVIAALSDQDVIAPFRHLLNVNYKENPEPVGEELIQRFIKNVLVHPNISPGKYLSPGFNNKDGEAVGQQYSDEAIGMLFHNFKPSETLKFWNYITDGELCPYGINGETTSNMLLNNQLEMQDENGEWHYWGFQDGLFNYKDSSDVDNPSVMGVIDGLQQSAISSTYSIPAVYDYGNLRAKQNIDARDFGPMSLLVPDALKELSPADMATADRNYEQKCKTEEFFDDLANSRAADTAAGGMWKRLSKSIGEVRRAFVKPVEIYDIQNGVKNRLSEEQIDGILSWYHDICGLNTYEDSKRNQSWFRFRQHFSHLISYADIKDSPYDADLTTMVVPVLEKWSKAISNEDGSWTGLYPMSKEMWTDSEVTKNRYGMMGGKAIMDYEWSLPAMQKLFDGDYQKFIEAAAKFNKEQYEDLINMHGYNYQKIESLFAYQLWLQDEWRGEGLDIGYHDPIDHDGRLTGEQLKVYETLQVTPLNDPTNTLLAELNKDRIEMIDRARTAERAGIKSRKYKTKEDLPARPVQQEHAGRGGLGRILDKLLGLRIGNSLVGNMPIAASAIGRTVGGGFIARQAGRFRFYLGEQGIVNQGSLPSDYSLITARSSHVLVKRYTKLQQKITSWGLPEKELAGYFQEPDRVEKTIREKLKEMGKIKAWQDLGGEFASGFGMGQGFVVSDWILGMTIRSGDIEWLQRHYPEANITEPLMTSKQWDDILSSDHEFHQWLAKATAVEGSPYSLLVSASMQDAQRITLARQNGIYQLFRAVMSKFAGPNAEKAFAVLVYPYMNYAINVTAWASSAMFAIPSETMLYALHRNGNKLQQYLKANGVSSQVMESIDWALLDSGKNLKQAMIRDAVRFGGFHLLALFAAGLMPIEDPEDDDLKDVWTEYTIMGMRISTLWPLSDMIGPIGPLIVYMHTVQNGKARPALLWNGFLDTVQNGAVAKASTFIDCLNDPLAWLDDLSDADMAYLNGQNPEEYDPEQAALNGFFLNGVGALYTLAVPSVIDNSIKMVIGDTTAGSANWIYEVDDSGKPTGRTNPDTGQYYLERADYDDIQWRRLTRNKPMLGLVKDLFSGSGLFGEKTGYMGHEMPNITRYDPFQVASAKMYEIIGDEEHDSQVAADIIFMLASFDDMDELVSTGFYMNAETRFYVGQKIWDAYWSYEEQINKAYEEGYNDYYALGDGDYMTGQKVWSKWLNDMKAQKQIYYDLYHEKLNSPALRTRMASANVLQQAYNTDAAGQAYGSGFPNSNPWAMVSVASQNNAGLEGGWSSESIITGLPVGERGWRWNTANSYYDSIDFEAHSENGDGKGYSSVFSTDAAIASLGTLESAYNPSASKTSRSGYGYSRSGGGGSSFPKIYSNSQDLNADNASIARLDRLGDSRPDYIKPEWETKGSREASRRSDI